jgi:hypothetical protein
MNIASSGSCLSRGLLGILKGAFAGLLAASAIPVALVPVAGAEPGVQPAEGNIRFEISLPAVTKEPSLTGRIFLFVAHTNQPEPRLQYKSFFGEEVLGWQEGRFEWWKHTPTGPDGYPLPVWDLATRKVDRAVVQAMREHDFDLRDYLERNWPRLGPKLIGKLHVCAADTDSFYSNLAVHLLEDFLRTTRDPHETGSFQYGPPGSHHGWQPTSNEELVRTMAKYMVSHRPSGD